jgi:hypothetical protein
MPLSVTVALVGGLGNQLFQLAALLHVARRTGRTPYIQTVANPSPHSDVSYFDTILSKFKALHSDLRPSSKVAEPSMTYMDWRGLLRWSPNPEMNGYFQDWRYVDPEFVSRLQFSPDVLTRYPAKDSIFLHIRGGDYVGHAVHGIHLDGYYQRAIEHFPDAHFLVVTNDVAYAKARPWLANVKYTLVDDPEIDTLYLMSQCKGGICANSSFSWWGAYLNPSRKIVMPDRWYTAGWYPQSGYYFPGVIKCPVQEPLTEEVAA